MAGARLSRILIIVLLGILGVGFIVYVSRAHPAPATQQASAPPAAPASQPISLIAVSETPSGPATPAAAPTTAPQEIQFVMAAAPADPAPAVQPPPPPTAPEAASATPIADAKAKIDAGDLLGGRAILNGALVSGSLSPADTITVKAMITQVNQTILFSDRRFASDPYSTTFEVPAGAAMERIAMHHGVTSAFLCRINNLSDPRKLRAGSTIKIIQGPFHAVVTKSTFTMDIYLGAPAEKGGIYVATFPVGLGKDDSTPTGVWLVQLGRKVRNPIYYSPRGAGVIAAEDPKNPLGHFWIGLVGMDGHAVGQQSYGIHGTNDESSIGQQASLGCIRMHNSDVAQVFDLLVDGKSTVIVKN